MKECIREKWPLKSEAEVSQIITEMISKKIRVDELLWKRLLYKLYP